MSFFEFDDVKRLHVGYQDPTYKCMYNYYRSQSILFYLLLS